eukprot:TRINITY_DN617_c0_g4_i1.p1 TRINITY_DN617_c0_g4~~TRINITY_DN617_c0_g4_i1.p1  ORF type:complete len:499 (+),score=93.72 TRINITY_DN617_c0_g4_i1:432-1928(+)
MSNTPTNQPATQNPNEPPSKRQRTKPAPRVTRENQLADAALHLAEQNWILGGAVCLRNEVTPALLRRRTGGGTPLDCFQKLVDPVVDLLLQIFNSNLDKMNNGLRRANKAEFFHWYATEMRRENTYANHLHNSREHMRYIKEKYGPIKKMGFQRFEDMLLAFRPQLEEVKLLGQRLTVSFQTQLTSVSLLLIDELVSAYQPSAAVKTIAEQTGEPIPRKPHPDGVEVLLGATFVSGHPKNTLRLPYLTHIIPHLSTGDSAPQDVLRQVVETWPLLPHPHYVGDAAFGSAQILDIIRQHGGVGTFSISTNLWPQLWQALSFNLPIDHFRVALQQQSGIVASIHSLHMTTDATKKTVQKLLSTGFTMTPAQAPLPQAALAPAVQPSPAIPAEQGAPVIPVYTEEDLGHKKVDELKAICQQFNIHYGKNKVSYVEHIMQCVWAQHRGEAQLNTMKLLRDFFLRDPATMHQFYNAWVGMSIITGIDWREFRELLATQLAAFV